jgi:hypothetical protein
MHNTQMRDGLLARNAQPDSTAQASSSKPAVTGNTQPWEIIRVRHAALDINAPPRMALRKPAVVRARTKPYNSKQLATHAQLALNVQRPQEFRKLAQLGPIPWLGRECAKAVR